MEHLVGREVRVVYRGQKSGIGQFRTTGTVDAVTERYLYLVDPLGRIRRETVISIEPLEGETVRLLVPQRVWSHIEGSQAYAEYRSGVTETQYDDATTISMVRKLAEAPVTRKDRRFWVELTVAEAESLRGYVEAFEVGARDNTWDEDGRADLFSATSFLKQMAKAGV